MNTNNQDCKHQFWKDENLPQCFNCGKTKEELISAQVIERDLKLKAQTRAETLKEAARQIAKLKEKTEIQTGSYKYTEQYDDCLEILANLNKLWPQT